MNTVENSSLEELIELPELPKPDIHNIIKRQNKVHSPQSRSPATTPKPKSDVVSLFSVKNAKGNVGKRSIVSGDSQSISELSDDVFDKEKTESVFSRSEKSSKSYKEKMRDRFRNIKEQAGVSSQKAKSKFTLPVDRIRKESDNIDTEVESARGRFNLNRDNVKHKEKYDFFTKENKELSIEEKEQSEDRLFYFTKAERHQHDVEIQEKEITYIPNNKNIEVSDKIETDEPRYLEMEGIFVDSELRIPKSLLNLVEHRILNCENKSKWFKCDGTLDNTSNPIKNRSIRPDINIDKNGSIRYSRPIFEEECSEIIVTRENTLNLTFSTLKFKHHPLFSTEHVLVQKLKDLYDDYVDFNENNKLQRIKNQLEALRLVKSNIEKFNEDSKKNKDNYLKEIKHLRELYFKESKIERENLKSILNAWKVIKKLRSDKKYSNTATKLIINKEKVDFASEKEGYDKFFEETLKEIINEKKKHYRLKMKAYNKKIEAVKEETKSDSDDTSENVPKKPSYDIDEEKITNELKKKFEDCVKPPGEPIIHFLLSENNEVSKESNSQEISRQNAVSSTNIALKVYCNKMFICKSKQVSLKDTFEIDFKETLSIQLTEIPKCLTVDIIEYPKGLLKKKIGTLEINLPSESISNKSYNLYFENKDIVHYKHEGVGSGTNLDDIEDKKYTCGILTYEIGWKKVINKEKSNGVDFELLDDIIDRCGAINTEKLKEWMEQDAPDPQDPKNSVLYEYFAENYLKPKENKNVFRLSPYMSSLNFCDIKEIEENVRIQMLRLRDQNEVEFDGVVIPNRIKEIPVSLLNAYKRRKSTEEKGVSLEIEDSSDRRSFGKKYLTEVYTKIYQKCKNTDNHLTYESVIDERYLIYFECMVKTAVKNLVNWFRWQPQMAQPLPKIAQSNKETEIVNNTRIEQPQVIIKILSGKNMPHRKIGTFNSGESSENLVQPFLEISYENVSVRTGSAVGTSPIWNETVILPLDCQHTDYLNPSSLTGTIHVDIFDESDFEVRKFDNRKQCNWLGELDIPLSAITSSNNLLNASFKVKSPPLLLGYETEIQRHLTKSQKTSNNLHCFRTYVDLEISLKPNVSKLWPNMGQLPTNEIPYIYDHILRWNELYNANFPSRKFSALVLDTNGKSNCVTKYIRPLEPPQLANEDFVITPEMCSRYISMIPIYESSEFHSNIWLTSDQLVNLTIGTHIDHAVALTCYFLALKIDAWLLLGYGSNVGSTAYVLIREYVQDSEIPLYYICDVVAAEKYNILDTFCPLRRVYCLISGENVWANTQRTDNMTLTRFDLSRKSDWTPLFDDNIGAPTNFANTKISYKLRQDTEALELYLEQKIRKKFSKLRRLDRTTWNYEISNLFKTYLRAFEVDATHNKSNVEFINDVNKSLENYNANGTIFNTCYISISYLMKKIKSLNLHIQQEGFDEFALSVFIQSYPGQIYSVWVFIGSVGS